MKNGKPKVSIKKLLAELSNLGQKFEAPTVGHPMCKRCSHPSNMHKAQGSYKEVGENAYQYPPHACSQCGKTCKFRVSEFPWLSITRGDR